MNQIDKKYFNDDFVKIKVNIFFEKILNKIKMSLVSIFETVSLERFNHRSVAYKCCTQPL